MIKINGMFIDCEIDYGRDYTRKYVYQVTTLDGKEHVKHERTVAENSATLSPRTIESHDQILELLSGDYDYLTIEDYDNSHVKSVKECIIGDFSTSVEKKIQDGVYKFGKISFSYRER